MQCLNLILKEKADNAIDVIGGLKVVLDPINGTLKGSNIVVLVGNLTGTVPLKLVNARVYPASSATDVTIAGKTELTSITANGYYIFNLIDNTQLGNVYLIFSTGNYIRLLDTNETIKQVHAYVEDIVNIPTYGSYLWMNFNPPVSKPYVATIDDLIKPDMTVSLFNIENNTRISGTWTDATTSNIYLLGSYFLQWNMISGEIDLSKLTRNARYVNLRGSANIICTSETSAGFLTTPEDIHIVINITMPSASIDNLLKLCAKKPNLAANSFIGSVITLKGTRTSASDAAVATLNAAGIAVNIT